MQFSLCFHCDIHSVYFFARPALCHSASVSAGIGREACAVVLLLLKTPATQHLH